MEYNGDTDYYPGADSGTSFMGKTYKAGYANWAQILYETGYLPKNVVGNKNASANKYATLGILECPSYKAGYISEDTSKKASFSNGYYAAYVYNACRANGADKSKERYFGVGRISEDDITVGRKVSQVRYPVSTMVIGDGDYSNYSSIGSDLEKRIARRHAFRINLLHGDGHVAPVDRIVSTFYLLYTGVPPK